MSPLLLAAFALSSLSSATLLVDARDLQPPAVALQPAVEDQTPVITAEGKLNITEAGDYAVWAWTHAEDKYQVVVQGQTFGLDPVEDDGKGKPYAWRQAGTLHLDAGEATVQLVSLGSGNWALTGLHPIASILLTTHADLKPQQLLDDERVYDQPQAARDERALTAKNTNTVFTFPVYNRNTWQAKKAELEKRVLLSSGLWPMPEKTPLNAVVSEPIDKGDYLIYKVYFEAYPGFLVTGNLYKPQGDGPFPGVVNPHGHWEKGRFENGERGSVPGRAITLARMGAVAFTYDMIGYNDSMQFSHGWTGDREKLWGLHPYALQLWSSVRSVDFLESLPYVDKERIGATGASGGGTQTFSLCAIDPRIKVAAPVNMISGNMQGGCICENAPILRLDNSNIEIGAMMAPKPLLMVSASGDWTRETPRVEYPAIQSIYRLYGTQARVKNVPIQADHNYNQASREAMYRFFGKWLLGRKDMENFTEPAFEVEPEESLRNFASKEDIAKFPGHDQLIQEAIARDQQKNDAHMAALAENPKEFKKEYQEVLRLVTGAQLPAAGDLQPTRIYRQDRDQYAVERWIISRKGVGDAVPLLYYRKKEAGPQDAVLLVHGEGKAALANHETGGPGPLIQALLDKGKAVITIDAFLLGEHNSPLAKTERYRVGGFMDTFEPTDTGCRIQDVLTSLAWIRSRRDLNKTPEVAGIGQAGLWTLLAASIDGKVDRLVADLNQFDANNDDAWVAQYYIPCIRAIGDVRAAVGVLAADNAPLGRHLIHNAPASLASPLSNGAVAISTQALSPEALAEALS